MASMTTSIPLRGTSRLADTISSPSGGKARRRRVAARCSASKGRNRPTSTPGGTSINSGSRLGPADSRHCLGRRVGAGGDDPDRAGQDAGQEPAGRRQPAGHGDLGAMKDDGIRQAEAGPDQPERQRRVEHDERGAGVGGFLADPPDERRRREQHGVRCAVHGEGLGSVPSAAGLLPGGQNGDVARRQSTPQLPQVGLDPADLGREVVGDEEVAHHADLTGTSLRRSSSSRTMGSASVATRPSAKSARPSRAAAQTA